MECRGLPLPSAINKKVIYQLCTHERCSETCELITFWTGQLAGPPPSLAEQLKQVLAERERRSSEHNSSAPQSLEDEYSQAVNEANARSEYYFCTTDSISDDKDKVVSTSVL